MVFRTEDDGVQSITMNGTPRDSISINDRLVNQNIERGGVSEATLTVTGMANITVVIEYDSFEARLRAL